jgi:hypothetical protein
MFALPVWQYLHLALQIPDISKYAWLNISSLNYIKYIHNNNIEFSLEKYLRQHAQFRILPYRIQNFLAVF